MATTTVNVRMDENLKKDFERLCNELGLRYVDSNEYICENGC